MRTVLLFFPFHPPDNPVLISAWPHIQLRSSCGAQFSLLQTPFSPKARQRRWGLSEEGKEEWEGMPFPCSLGLSQTGFQKFPFPISGSARENNCGKQSPEPVARLSLTYPTGLCLPADVIKHVPSSRDPKLTNFIHQPSTEIEGNQSQVLLTAQS